MTSKHKIKTPARPAPVELTEEDLNAAAGGILIGLLLPAIQKVREPAAVQGNFIGTNAAGTAA